MNTAVTTPQTFEDRVFQRMRENIGELMTDEEMKKLLATAVERMFFTSTRRYPNNYHDQSMNPPEIYKLVSDLVEPMLKKALQEYLIEHSAEVQKAIEAALAGGLVAATARAIESLTSESFANLHSSLAQLTGNLHAKGSL